MIRTKQTAVKSIQKVPKLGEKTIRKPIHTNREIKKNSR